MKKIILALTLLLVSVALCEQITVTTNATSISVPTAFGAIKMVSVHNTGTNVVFFRKNITAASFATTSAIPIAAGASYTSPITGSASGRSADVGNIVLATTNGTSVASVAFDN